MLKLDWIEQCFTSPPTQSRLYGRRVKTSQQWKMTDCVWEFFNACGQARQLSYVFGWLVGFLWWLVVTNHSFSWLARQCCKYGWL